MEKSKKIITHVLVIFSLISIGYAFGKNSVSKEQMPAFTTNQGGDYVAVYYLHSSFRCVTCNTIEQMTIELLEQSYAKERHTELIRWDEIDFQEHEAIAKKFDVIASCIVVAWVENGKVKDFQRLDDVWTLMKEPRAFDAYVSDAIDSYLNEMEVQQ
ncbi:hypothetical protein JD969_16225 [Planctomycetota bacterium]|nr:hypothetical protein JD969_16225 [Planctomycetota bacterium]